MLRGSAERPTATDAFSKTQALFRSHLFQTFLHTSVPSRTASMMTMEASKEDLREKEQPQGLPEGDVVTAKDLRHQYIPESLHSIAQSSPCNDHEEQTFEYFFYFV
jgi:hypothetical protein